MEKILTIRLDAAQQEKLGQTARLLGKTVSEFVREIIQQALEERSVEAKAGHLRGQISLPSPARDPWARQIKERNWRK